ncbi:hypothetical protein [Moraxella equi]|uniref:Uncharacterized protein n=1 Tax=Moraxella equi TaxID=60442 RepID=A0A378QNH1_9GAMM|nr:hypothetical protein [Moraxella equi]OPH36301.1 hypothetical protein B5J93_09590 [Moraxella equi]STZ02032.1 Uncharacterised protein [Moraxella equi]
MRLINEKTGQTIELPYDLYPIDDLNWSAVVSKTDYTLTGALDVQQGTRKAGKPLTLQSQDDMGVITRQVVNELHEWANLIETTFIMEYEADGQTKKVSVMFDHSQTPIEATPLKEFNSPNLDDYFRVVLKFFTV